VTPAFRSQKKSCAGSFSPNQITFSFGSQFGREEFPFDPVSFIVFRFHTVMHQLPKLNPSSFGSEFKRHCERPNLEVAVSWRNRVRSGAGKKNRMVCLLEIFFVIRGGEKHDEVTDTRSVRSYGSGGGMFCGGAELTSSLAKRWKNLRSQTIASSSRERTR